MENRNSKSQYTSHFMCRYVEIARHLYMRVACTNGTSGQHEWHTYGISYWHRYAVSLHYTHFQTNQYHLPSIHCVPSVLSGNPILKHIFGDSHWWAGYFINSLYLSSHTHTSPCFVVANSKCIFLHSFHAKLRNGWNDCLIDMKSTISLVVVCVSTIYQSFLYAFSLHFSLYLTRMLCAVM